MGTLLANPTAHGEQANGEQNASHARQEIGGEAWLGDSRQTELRSGHEAQRRNGHEAPREDLDEGRRRDFRKALLHADREDGAPVRVQRET